MAKNKGPLKGVYVPVKLPWKGVAHDNEQFVSIKRPIAEYFKLEPAKKTDLTYKTKIRYKERNADGKPAGQLKTKEVTKTRSPGHRQRAVRVIFGDRKKGIPSSVKVGERNVKSCQFPITKSVSISDIREEFLTGRWKNLPVIRIVEVNTGQGYPIY